MNNIIITIDELLSNGKKLGKIVGNRPIDPANVKEKKKSLKIYGQLSSAIYMQAETLMAQGYQICDWYSNEVINMDAAKDYVVIIDGQHRTAAHFQLQKEDPNYKFNFYLTESLNTEADGGLQLFEMNTVQQKWDGKNLGVGAKTLAKGKSTPVLDYVSDLAKKGYSLPAASLWATLEDKITASCLKKVIQGNMPDVLTDSSNLSYGMQLHDAATKKFGDSFLKGRTFPNWISSQFNKREGSKQEFVNAICGFFSTLDRESADSIEKTKGTRGGDTKETLINRELNRLFEAYIQTNLGKSNI